MLALLTDVQGNGVVEAWLAHLHKPDLHVQKALLHALTRYDHFRKGDLHPRVLEALAGLLDRATCATVYRSAIRALKDIGVKAALPYLEEALSRVEESDRRELQSAIDELKRRER